MEYIHFIAQIVYILFLDHKDNEPQGREVTYLRSSAPGINPTLPWLKYAVLCMYHALP